MSEVKVAAKVDESIHPRVQNGKAIFPKVNTAAPAHVPPGKKLRKALKRLEDRRHARNNTTSGKPERESAYKTPGCMKSK